MTPKPKSVGKLTFLRLTPALHERLKAGLTTGQGSYQRTFRRILDAVRQSDKGLLAIIAGRELAALRDYASRDDAGGWQDWAREALEHNRL